MQISETAANQNHESPSHASESNSTLTASGLTASEQQLISRYRKVARSGLDLPATVAHSLLAYMVLAESLRQSIYDLQTMLTLSGMNSTTRSREIVTFEIELIKQAWAFALDTWADQVYYATGGGMGEAASPDSVEFQ